MAHMSPWLLSCAAYSLAHSWPVLSSRPQPNQRLYIHELVGAGSKAEPSLEAAHQDLQDATWKAGVASDLPVRHVKRFDDQDTRQTYRSVVRSTAAAATEALEQL